MPTYVTVADNIRAFMNSHKAEKYPFDNPAILCAEESIKKLYYSFLCILIQYGDSTNIDQITIFKRMLAGAKIEESFEDYLAFALELDAKKLVEFIDSISNSELKYYFVLDGILILSLSNSNDKQYMFLAELAEFLNVTKDELEYLAQIAKSSVTQDSKSYKESQKKVPATLFGFSALPYIKNFYSGIVSNTPSLFYCYSKTKNNISVSGKQYSAKKVVFENIHTTIDSIVEIRNCEEVTFKNCLLEFENSGVTIDQVGCVNLIDCKITGGQYSSACFNINNTKDVKIEHCIFTKVQTYLFCEERIKNISFLSCTFDECGYSYSRSRHDWYELGGLFRSNKIETVGINQYINCLFKKCQILNTSNYYSSDFISNCISQLENCSFVDCWHLHGANLVDPADNRRRMFPSSSTVIDCTSENSASIN